MTCLESVAVNNAGTSAEAYPGKSEAESGPKQISFHLGFEYVVLLLFEAVKGICVCKGINAAVVCGHIVASTTTQEPSPSPPPWRQCQEEQEQEQEKEEQEEE